MRKTKIAIVDDEVYFLNMLSQKISNMIVDFLPKYSIRQFTSGAEFLSQHEQENFDVVFLDIAMPGINGFEVAKIIRQISKKICIIFVTTECELVYDFFDFQPLGFIPK